jgi:site-specific DNA-methyltransferase (adenine-specific)
VRLLNEQNNDTDYADSGGASRFFYCAKVSPDERWGFCKDCGRAVSPEELDTHRTEKHRVTVHPTQKPLELMRWLVRLVTPPGGTVLDPFAGSGTTLVAAVLEGSQQLAKLVDK